jgi:hypothetical protein
MQSTIDRRWGFHIGGSNDDSETSICEVLLTV